MAAIAEAQELERQSLTLNEMFNDWIAKDVARQDGNQEIQRLFNKDVLPKIGSAPVKDIKESDILNVYRGILERGTQVNPRFRSLVKLAADMRQLFKWAEARQPWRALLIEGNPALLANEKILLDVNYTEERDRILTPTEIVELDRLIKFEAQTYIEAVNKSNANRPLNESTQCAIWICLSTLSRIGELLMARWDQVDFQTREWFIPRENIKSTRGKKQDHHVFLSDFSLAQFKRL